MKPDLPRTAYRIETERLVLRCWSPDDAASVREALDASDGHLRPWIPWMADEPRSLEATAQWLRLRRARFDLDEDFRYGVFSSGEAELFGELMYSKRTGPGAREIGYWMDARRSGSGYATEASAAAVRFAFEVDGVERVDVFCSPENGASAAVARKLGFTHDATLRKRARGSDGKIQDSMVWSLFADEYPGCPAVAVAFEAFDALGRKLAPVSRG